MPGTGRYEVEEYRNESSTDLTPTEDRNSFWTTNVESEYLNFSPDKLDNTHHISVLDWNSPSNGAVVARKENGKKMTEKETRRMEVRGGLFVLIAVSVIVAIGVTIALIVILTAKLSPDSEPSTTPPTQTLQFVTYTGQMRLLEDWLPEYSNESSPEYRAKVASIVDQLDNTFMSSVLWRYYNHSSINSLQNGSIITSFNLIFSTLREYTPLDGGSAANISVSPSVIGAVIVEQFIKQVFSLPLDKDSVIIVEVTTTTAVTSTTQESTPTSTPADMCVPLDFPVCQQFFNFTTLPAENHTAAVEFFNAAYQPMINTRCNSSEGIALFCSLRFTPCDSQRQQALLPCRQLCLDVSEECGLVLPCDDQERFLESDCFTVDGGKSTTTVTTVSSSTVTSTVPDICVPLDFPVCHQFFNFTTLPAENHTGAVEFFNAAYQPMIDTRCNSQKGVALFCSLRFTPCDSQRQQALLPCRQLCLDVSEECGLVLPCDDQERFLESDCFTVDGGKSTTTATTVSSSTVTSTVPDICVPLDFPVCHQFFNFTTLPAENHTGAVEFFNAAYQPMIDTRCNSQKGVALFCSLRFTPCDSQRQQALLPCRQLCLDVSEECGLVLPCDDQERFLESDCFTVDGGISTTTTVTSTATTSTVPSSCYPLEVDTCREEYGYTTLPVQNQTETARRLDRYFGYYLSQNCSQHARAAFCGGMFEQCDVRTGNPLRVCKQLCEVVNEECSIVLPCDNLPVFPEPCYDGGMGLTTVLPETTTQGSNKCEQLEFGVCRSLYSFTRMRGDRTQQQVADFFTVTFQPTIERQCSDKARDFYCYLQFPRCYPQTGKTIGPCRRLCEEVGNSCDQQLPCSRLPDTDCYYDGVVPAENITTLSPPTTTPYLGKCSEVKVALCKALYPTTVLIQGQNESTLIQRFDGYTAILDSECSAMAPRFLCADTFPRCYPSVGIPQLPCQDLCTAFIQGCGTRFNLNFDCSRYPEAGRDCVGVNDVVTKSTVVSSTPTVSSTLSTTPKRLGCEPLTSQECQGLLPYNSTFFPNVFGHPSPEEAHQALDRLLTFQPDCSLAGRKLLLCPLLFPKCMGQKPVPVCRAVCDGFSPACHKHLGLSCDQFPDDDDPDVCFTSGVADPYHLIRESPCSGFACTNEKCLPDRNKVCDGVNDCGDFSDEIICGEESAADCDFELGTSCSYRQSSDEGNDWLIHNSFTPSAFTGPRYDNTYKNQSGHYMYLEATGVKPGAIGQLVLPERDWAETHCFRVNYHMRGQGMGSLKILTRETEGNKTSLHWTVSGDIGNKWETGAVSLPKGRYSIVVEGVRGQNYKSDISVDDITSRKGACPASASSCVGGQFRCNSTGVCLPESRRCDTVNDCGDFSDEVGCDCSDKQYYFQCKYGNCIKAYMQCNNETDCPDGSDEVNCVCPNGQWECASGECIMSEWLCDGDVDCRDGSDEDSCLRCGVGQHTCQDYSCVPEDKVCDGQFDCADRSDENYCVRRRSWDNMLEMRHGVFWLPVCHSGWDAALGDRICAMTGDGLYNGTVRLNFPSTSYLNYNRFTSSIHWMQNLRKTNSCEDASVIGIRCHQRGCGTRSVPLVSSYIVGGKESEGGRWPWMASLTVRGRHDCGGTLIAPQFVLTAAHCVEDYEGREYLLKVVLGGTAWGVSQPNRKQYSVQKVITHPKYFAFSGNDIGLVQLQTAVVYDKYISPACLPEPEELFPTSSLCFIAGWGQTFAGSGVVGKLREAKIKLWQTAKCNGSLAWNGSISDSDICAGYSSGTIATCHGDSGGPLMCRDQTKRWTLVGVSSYVVSNCVSPGFPPVFTDVEKQLQWIHSHIECKFRCDNGRCLYDNQLVCNRENNCGDNSDEIRVCDSSVNCTFDDPFLCGYTFSQRPWFSATGLDIRTPYPSHDHTQAKAPGMYMGSNGRGSLQSPRFTINTTHCVRFFYNYVTSETLNGDFVVVVDFFGSDGGVVRKEMFRAANTSDSELWKMASFQLPPGTFQVIFEAYITQIVAVDDVLALPGSCDGQGCLPGEFPCPMSGCITESEVCNLALQCSVRADDEFTCTERKPYNCTFEDNLACGMNRIYGKSGNSWTLQNGVANRELRVKTDHTLSTDQGQFMYSRGEEPSAFGTLLLLPAPEYCLQFYYTMFSVEAQLVVRAEWSVPTENSVTVISLSGRRNATWNRAVISLPQAPYSTLLFSFSTPYKEQNDFTFAAVDDILVSPGECPAFTCPAGLQKCLGENYCVSPTQVCDRKVDCSDFSDESNCTCLTSEFRCSNGLCLSADLTCNGVQNCEDGSDELVVCGDQRSAACDFESPFICGYSVNSSSGFSWIRNKGSTDSRQTGPSADHTYGNYTGHYLYTEASAGKAGDITEATTPMFTSSTGDNLVFYYNMRGTEIGELAVLSSDQGTPSKQRLWNMTGDQGVGWEVACVPLPTGPSVSVTFVVTYGGGNKGDVAIDDVSVTSNPCPAPTTKPASLPSTTIAPCPPGQLPCSNLQCLSDTLFCNNFNDCPDGSDELNCPAP